MREGLEKGTGNTRRFLVKAIDCEDFNPVKLCTRIFGSVGMTVLVALPKDVVMASKKSQSLTLQFYFF